MLHPGVDDTQINDFDQRDGYIRAQQSTVDLLQSNSFVDTLARKRRVLRSGAALFLSPFFFYCRLPRFHSAFTFTQLLLELVLWNERAAPLDPYSHDVVNEFRHFIDDRIPDDPSYANIDRRTDDESPMMFANLQLVTTTTAL